MLRKLSNRREPTHRLNIPSTNKPRTTVNNKSYNNNGNNGRERTEAKTEDGIPSNITQMSKSTRIQMNNNGSNYRGQRSINHRYNYNNGYNNHNNNRGYRSQGKNGDRSTRRQESNYIISRRSVNFSRMDTRRKNQNMGRRPAYQF